MAGDLCGRIRSYPNGTFSGTRRSGEGNAVADGTRGLPQRRKHATDIPVRQKV